MWVRNINLVPLVCALTRDRTHKLGLCPDWESNHRPFALPDEAQPTEPHWSGPRYILISAHIMSEEIAAQSSRDLLKAVGPERKSVIPDPMFLSYVPCVLMHLQLLPKYLQNHDHRRETVHLIVVATVP